MPRLPRNCYRTRYGYQFRVVVPEVLRAIVGKREIKKSLGCDYRDAIAQARVLAIQVDRQFETLRQGAAKQQAGEAALAAYLGRTADKRLKPITEVTPELVGGLRSLWLASLDADLAWRREGLDDDEFDSLQANIGELKQGVARALARGQVEPFVPVVRTLLIGRGYELAVTPEAERRLVLDLLPAIQQGYDILEQRQAGRLVEPPPLEAPPLPSAWDANPVEVEQGLTWEALISHWRQDRPRPARTKQDAETAIKALVAFVPKATRPATLTRAQVTEWLRHERETRGNSAKTLEKKGTLVGAMFSVAVKDELVERNPFAGFDYSRFAAKEGMENPDEREPFTLAQLKRIFSADEGLFGVTKATGGGGYYTRVWMPLLALYTGARLDELGRLTVGDIVREPVPSLRIRRGKTQSSVRDVPIHPKLVELGFLDYVDAIRAAGHASLWPDLNTRSETANDSEVLGKWFNRFVHTKLKLPPAVVFHSFRHTFKDLCRDALIPRDLHHALTGHGKGEEGNVGDDYGKGYSLETKRAEMTKIRLDLVIPRPRPFGPVGASATVSRQ